MKGNPSIFSYPSNEASPVARAVASNNVGDISNLNDTRDSPNNHNVESRNHRGRSPSHLQAEEEAHYQGDEASQPKEGRHQH